MNQTVFTHNGFPKVGIRPIIDGRRRGVWFWTICEALDGG